MIGASSGTEADGQLQRRQEGWTTWHREYPLFSEPTRNLSGARDLSRRNVSTADRRLEISRPPSPTNFPADSSPRSVRSPSDHANLIIRVIIWIMDKRAEFFD